MKYVIILIIIGLSINIPIAMIAYNHNNDILEFTPFKESVYNYYKNELKLNDNNWDIDILLKYPLNSNFPQSYIVYGKLNKEYEFYLNGIIDKFKRDKIEFLIRSYCLYEKYIKRNSEFEINIDYLTRNKLTKQINNIGNWIHNKKFDNMNINEILKYIYNIFDGCINQMKSLLRASYARYQDSSLYTEFIKLKKSKYNKK